MRRALVGVACLAVLLLATASTALAKGPHHHGPGRHGHNHWRGPGHHNAYRYHKAYRLPPRGPICRTPIAPYPVYPAPVVTAYPTFPRLGFGLGGQNFSFWFQQ